MTVVKICGIRTLEEGRVALAAGANWLGFVFWPRSRRFVGVHDAARIAHALRGERGDWAAAGVFVDPSLAEVADAASACGLAYAQLCGDEDHAFVRHVRDLGVPVVKALRVPRGEEAGVAAAVCEDRFGADRYLLDAQADGTYGGTGTQFDWEALRDIGPRCFAAGGLRPDNVRGALQTLAPYGVDVSSGVEHADGRGGKDPALVRQFLHAVRGHDQAEARHS